VKTTTVLQSCLDFFEVRQGSEFWQKIACESEFFFEKNCEAKAKRKRSEREIIFFAFAVQKCVNLKEKSEKK
jgi:hypothetical protein